MSYIKKEHIERMKKFWGFVMEEQAAASPTPSIEEMWSKLQKYPAVKTTWDSCAGLKKEEIKKDKLNFDWESDE